MTAAKRIAADLAQFAKPGRVSLHVDVADLRAVLAECAELRERVRLAREKLGDGWTDDGYVESDVPGALYLLDLRRPLPKRATRKRARK